MASLSLLRLLIVGIALFVPAGAADAHESRPIYLDITEIQRGSFQLTWKAPPSIPAAKLPVIALPDYCIVAGDVSRIPLNAYYGRRIFNCFDLLLGAEIAINFANYNPSISTLIKIKTMKGEEHLGLLGPQETRWRIPNAETPSGVARQYAFLGMLHIWKGWDHLLFLIALLWIAGSLRRVLITVTGFTLAHSATLALSALELLSLPTPPVEAAIALSIIFLAREIASGRRNTLTWRYPLTVSSSFGLLHGLGFAAVLKEIGFPQTELLTGLLFFNVGVEFGQIVFIAGVAAITLAAATMIKHTPYLKFVGPATLATSARLTAAYAIGTMASFWLIERMMGFG